MADRYDDDYWNVKYAEAHCHEHPDADLWYDSETGEWICPDDDEGYEADGWLGIQEDSNG